MFVMAVTYGFSGAAYFLKRTQINMWYSSQVRVNCRLPQRLGLFLDTTKLLGGSRVKAAAKRAF